MDEIGNSTQSTYCIIGIFYRVIIDLTIDYMGGYGKNEYMLEYSKYLAATYNIVFFRQVPWSPKTNIVDIGSWMTVQSKIEKYHFINVKQHYSLVRSVNNSWYDVEEHTLTKI